MGSAARLAQDMVIWRDIVKALPVPLGIVRLSVCCQLLLKSVVFNTPGTKSHVYVIIIIISILTFKDVIAIIVMIVIKVPSSLSS